MSTKVYRACHDVDEVGFFFSREDAEKCLDEIVEDVLPGSIGEWNMVSQVGDSVRFVHKDRIMFEQYIDVLEVQ